jgi:predicted PurR-regulated permease PerM
MAYRSFSGEVEAQHPHDTPPHPLIPSPTSGHSSALAPAIYLSLTVVEGQLITPTVAGRRLAMNPVAVFLAIAFWGWLWGVIGMLVAVPLTVAIKVFCSHISPLATFADFLSAEPGPPAEPEPP